MTGAHDKARIEEQLALGELLIALAEQSAARQRVLTEERSLEGEALARALTDLAFIESTEALRKAERKRLLAALRSV